MKLLGHRYRPLIGFSSCLHFPEDKKYQYKSYRLGLYFIMFDFALGKSGYIDLLYNGKSQWGISWSFKRYYKGKRLGIRITTVNGTLRRYPYSKLIFEKDGKTPLWENNGFVYLPYWKECNQHIWKK